MGEILGEIIGQLIIEIIGKLFIAIGGATLDAPLKLIGVKIPWGFCYKTHKFAAFLNIIILLLIPIHIYNFGFTNGLFIYLGIFFFIIIVLCYMNTNFEFLKAPSDLLDDEFPK